MPDRLCKVMGHRGAPHQEKENTEAAFRRAVELGADWIELDVRFTRDGALCVHHDPRLPDGFLITETDTSALPGHVPTLVAALAACHGAKVNVEIKHSPDEPGYDPDFVIVDRVAAVVTPDELISCFDWDTLLRWRAVRSDVPCAFLTVERIDAALVDRVRAAGMVAVHPWDRTLDEHGVRIAREAGLDVHVWTVDDPTRMAELLEWGVTGLCSNKPDVARLVVDRWSGAGG
jgi:glycerophosphoryl diester phosphodiesterase